MAELHVGRANIRRSFDKIRDIVPVPNLIKIQSSSFNDFVQFDYLPSERLAMGLEKVLRDVFPIEYEGKMSLEYVSYELGNWACTCGKLTGLENRYQWQCSGCKASGCSRLDKGYMCPQCNKKGTARYKTCVNCLSRVVVQLPMTVDECRSGGHSFSMSLKVKIQLINWTVDEDDKRSVRDIKEQTIFFADLPVMVDLYEERGRFFLGSLGTFLINGVDRVIVSQLHRSPGAVFSQSKKIKDFRGRPYYLARIIPMRGSWLDFEFDSNDLLYVRIDKKKKLLVTTFLQALGIPRDEIIPLFYNFDCITVENGDFSQRIDASLIGQRIEKGVLPEKESKIFTGRRVTNEVIEKLHQAGVKKFSLEGSHLLTRIIAKDVIDPKTGEVILQQGEVVTEDHIALFLQQKKLDVYLIQSSGYVFQPTVAITLNHDRCFSQDEALREFHAKVWPGDSALIKDLKERLENIFNGRFYDLTKVGRIRMNRKLGLSEAETVTVLTRNDIIATVRYLVNLRERGEGELDDIDHLGNRRVRLVGELLNNQMYIGFMRIDRIVRERFRMKEAHGAHMPQDFLSVKPLNAVIREFFGLGQLSQFMDQTNPLSEIAHKRRLSALGPGGVLKDRATFEVRDVHTSHYGRICPIETPEGQTVGLISSLATYAVVNDLGFIETGYRPVESGKIGSEVKFLDAFEESECYIAQTDSADYAKNELVQQRIFARHDGNLISVERQKVDYIDLSPKQLVSVSAALIPFLEHDDAVRALMGANMQRQAVPLVKARAPVVGTGMEGEIVKASGAVIVAKRSGVVEYVCSDKIIIRAYESEFDNQEDWLAGGIDTYYLRKFEGSSYSTWIHHTPIVKNGDIVESGEVLTNGPAVENGELALGSNLLIALMPWNGYNFEDAIVVSNRLVAEDVLTSVHIDEHSVEARDTKLGPEEITKDIPNVSDAALASLDEDGIVRVGTRVRAGDILVGKVTLKGDIQYSPEEKLLRAIFGEKSREVRDTSLRVPPGGEGVIIGVKIFSRSGIRKDKRYKEEIGAQVAKLEADYQKHLAILESMVVNKMASLLHGQVSIGNNVDEYEQDGVLEQQKMVDKELVKILAIKVKSKTASEQLKVLKDLYDNQLRILDGLKEERIAHLKRGDVLPSGVVKLVKVYVAMKRPVSVGDKIAGRHGNKGVVSIIVRREDMPYLDDGTSVDVVLNPLGVPSRMNVGQILEIALGLVGTKLGERVGQVLASKQEAALRECLSDCYGAQFIKQYEKNCGYDGLLDLAERSKERGVFFRTPVFDGATYEGDIKPLMADLSLPVNSAFRLRDGRTGEYFDQPVTVGCMYIMKLNHMVDDKLHARSTGPYSLVTQQPLGGKAQQGGQRLGEMEVWAFQAYGAAGALQELLTYKSDDVSGRYKVYASIVKGENVHEPGVPESFNVLVKELQGLALQVDLLKISKEDVGG